MELAEIVTSHHERAVARVGDVYLKVETDPDRAARELLALETTPTPAPSVLWSQPGPPALLAITAAPGTPLGRLGDPSPHPRSAWQATGAVARALHDSDPPDGLRHWLEPGSIAHWIEGMRTWLLDHEIAPRTLVDARAGFAHDVLDDRTVSPVFTHGDYQAAHIYVDNGEVVSVIDWGDTGVGDPLYDLATLTVGHGEHLDAVIDGYGSDVDRDVIRGYWYLRRLGAVRWMTEHGYDPTGDVHALTIE